MPQSEPVASPIESLIADIKIAARRLSQRSFASVDDAHAEFRDNVYPTLVQICEQMMEVDEIVGDYIENRGSYVEPALAAQIFGALILGSQLVGEVRKLVLDDVTRERVVKLCDEYERAAEVASRSVGDAVEEVEDDEDDDEKSDEPDGDEGAR